MLPEPLGTAVGVVPDAAAELEACKRGGSLKGSRIGAGVLVPTVFPGPGYSAELSHSLQVLDRGGNSPKALRNRSESACDDLWARPRAFVAWLRPVWGPISVPNQRFPVGFLKVFRDLLAQPRVCPKVLNSALE